MYVFMYDDIILNKFIYLVFNSMFYNDYVWRIMEKFIYGYFIIIYEFKGMY